MAGDALGPWWQQINDYHPFVTWVICLLERINSSEINFYTVWFYNIGGIAADLCAFESLFFLDLLFSEWASQMWCPLCLRIGTQELFSHMIGIEKELLGSSYY